MAAGAAKRSQPRRPRTTARSQPVRRSWFRIGRIGVGIGVLLAFLAGFVIDPAAVGELGQAALFGGLGRVAQLVAAAGCVALLAILFVMLRGSNTTAKSRNARPVPVRSVQPAKTGSAKTGSAKTGKAKRPSSRASPPKVPSG